MSPELTLRGNNYNGRFSARQDVRERDVGSGYGEALADFKFWEGVGEIEDIRTGKSERFFFSTVEKEDGRQDLGDLEGEIVRITRNYKEVEVQLVEKRQVYDVVLEQIFRDSEELSAKGEIIPGVFPQALDYVELVEKGLVSELVTN